MKAFDPAGTFSAMQREILRTAARTANLVWIHAFAVTDLMIKQNPFVPESGKKILCNFLESYLDFIEKKKDVLEVMNGASEDIMSFVLESVRCDNVQKENSDINEQVLKAVKGGTRN